jgi:hypothetical protein
MSAVLRFSALTLAASLLAACGGGGSGASAPVTPAKPTTAPTTGPASKTPIATASLRIVFPANFHKAKLSSKAVAKAAAKVAAKTPTGSRLPAYVNPGSGAIIDVFVVDNTQDSVTDVVPGQAIQATSDGSQTINIPLYSTDAQDIVAVESWGGLGNAILAIGEADLGSNSFQAGSAPLIGLTMQMNVSNVGMMTGPSDAGGDATAFSVGSSGNSFNFSGSSNICSPGQTAGPFYAFATDPTGGFASNYFGSGQQTGTGGISTPLLVTYTFDQITGGVTVSSDTSAGSQNVGYTETFPTVPGTSVGATFQFSVTSPAGTIANDALNNGGSLYPGVYEIEQSFGYDVLNLASISINPGITSIDVSGFCD